MYIFTWWVRGMIEVKNVTKYYEIGKVHALRDLSLKFEDGKFYVVAGASGSGKTTLINLLAGIDLPSKGSVIVDGKNMARMKEKERRSFRLENMGFVFQFFYLVPYLTGKENVMLPMRYSRKIAEPEKRAMHLLRLVNGEHLADKKPIHMSGGEMQRIAIARALANDPKYLLADEPTANLDWKNKERIWKILKKVNEEGTTVIVATHEREFFHFGDELINLRDGMLYAPEDSH
ncbi:MAG: ABC transporter ATP-binding protein [Thermoplasmata archaeon]|nr:ABC transporter ATP-binding protein [Thermoplasmata archaeon]